MINHQIEVLQLQFAKEHTTNLIESSMQLTIRYFSYSGDLHLQKESI